MLNISKNVTIVFFDDDTSKDEVKATEKEKEKEEKEIEKNKEAKENEKTKEMTKKQKKLRLGKLVFRENKDSNGNENMIANAGNTLTMGNFDKFNCLLIGCCIAMAKSIENKNKTTTTTTTFLDAIFANIQPFFGKAWTRKDISLAKEEIDSVLALLIDVLNFTNGSNGSKSQSLDDESLIIRLAMILCASSENITQLSFVKDYIETKQSRKANIRNKTAKEIKKSNDSGDAEEKEEDDDDVVVTAGAGEEKKKEKEKKKENEDESTTSESVKSSILKMKNVIDKSLIKMMIYQVGCFINLYNLVKGQGKQLNVIGKFITYFYFFENVKGDKKSNFLLSMKHGVNGDNLLSIARESNDNGNLYKALSKFIESNEVLNDKFRDYGKYFNEMSTSIRTKLSPVEYFACYVLFCFVLFLLIVKDTPVCLFVCCVTFDHSNFATLLSLLYTSWKKLVTKKLSFLFCY